MAWQRLGAPVAAFFALFLVAGCVSQKEHTALKIEYEHLEEQAQVLREKNARLIEENEAIKGATAPTPEAPAEKPAPTSIADGQAQVDHREGMTVITVNDEILFAPGEAEISSRGKKVLAEVAELLRTTYADGAIRVEGHTDNTPIRKTRKKWASNWELSVARALSVVHYLIDSCGISAKRIHPAGYSMYHPVASNDTAAGRARNRRVEIVILKGLTR